MAKAEKPLVLSSPAPRTLDLILSPSALGVLHEKYEIIEVEPTGIAALDDNTLAQVRFIVGQPPLSQVTLTRMRSLRCIFNVEGNLLDNMPYDYLFQHGIHVVTPSQVFAEPVAEIGLAFALDLARGVVDADLAFRQGNELWGSEGNRTARLLSGSEVGFIGFGDLGKALHRLLQGFRARIKAFDPWLPPSVLIEHGVTPASLDEVLSGSDLVFVVASATSENQGFLDARSFASMRKGAAFILLSRAGVVDFPDLMEAVRSGHILAASDVFPEEPPAKDHPVRSLPGFLRSAHRAGALDIAFKRMGEMVLEDMALIDRNLPPMRCKRAERETVSRMRSKPVDKS